MAEWIAELIVLPEVETKLHEKHQGLTLADVREAICFGAASRVDWDDDPKYGRRLIATGVEADGREIVAFLDPIDEADGKWELLTAWRL